MSLNFLDSTINKTIRKVAGWGVRPVAALGFIPNQVTLFGFVFFMVPAVFFFTKGSYFLNIVGLLLVSICEYFDNIDGMLARRIGKSSEAGSWLDKKLDLIGAEAIIIGIAVAVIRLNQSLFWLIISVLAIFGRINFLVLLPDYNQAVFSNRKFLEKFKKDHKITVVDKLVKEIVVLESFFFRFFFTCRYLLILAVFFNQLKWFLFLVAIFSNLRWPIMFWAYFKALDNGKSRLRVIRLLRQCIDS